MPDVKTLHRVPLLLQENGVFSFLSVRLNLISKTNFDQTMMIKWKEFIER